MKPYSIPGVDSNCKKLAGKTLKRPTYEALQGFARDFCSDKMKNTGVILLAFVGACCLLQEATAVGTTMLDRVNVESYLRNPKMIEYHIRCLVYDGPCDKIGEEIKRLLPLVGKQCRGCSEEQKAKLGMIINHIQRNYPSAWQDMVKRLRNY